MKMIHTHYSTDLDIIPTTGSSNTFLGLHIVVEDGRFVNKLYNKRRDFVIKVNAFHNLRSSISNKTCHDTYIGELHRVFVNLPLSIQISLET